MRENREKPIGNVTSSSATPSLLLAQEFRQPTLDRVEMHRFARADGNHFGNHPPALGSRQLLAACEFRRPLPPKADLYRRLAITFLWFFGGFELAPSIRAVERAIPEWALLRGCLWILAIKA